MVPAMTDEAMDATPARDNYKRRSVSAVRRFPKGCGRYAPSLAAGGGLGQLSANGFPQANGALLPEEVMVTKEEFEEFPDRPTSENMDVENALTGRIEATSAPHQVEVVGESRRAIETNDTTMPLHVGVPKPQPEELPGPSVSLQPEEVRIKLSKNVNHVETCDLSRSVLETGDLSNVVVNHNVGKEGHETDLVAKVEHVELPKESSFLPNVMVSMDGSRFDIGISKLYGPSKRRDVPVIRHFPPGCGRRAMPIIREGSLKAATEVPVGISVQEGSARKQRTRVSKAEEQAAEMVEEDVGRKSLDKTAFPSDNEKKISQETCGNKMEHAPEICRDVGSHYFGTSEEVSGRRQEETSGSPMVLSGYDKRTSDVYKNDKPRHVIRVKSENASQEEQYRKRSLSRVGDRQVDRKPKFRQILENDLPGTDVRIQSQPCKMVKNEKITMEKSRKMKKELNPRDQSWKQQETEEAACSQLKSKESMGLAVHADKIIVQALMAAPKCPWRQGKSVLQNAKTPVSRAKKEVRIPKRKSSDIVATSLPGNKAKKEVRIPKRKCLSFETSLYQPNDKDREDSLLEDGEHERALIVYPGAQELSISLPPFGPSDLHLDGGSDGEAVARTRVRKVLRLFQVICRKLLQCEESKQQSSEKLLQFEELKPKSSGQKLRVDLTASGILKDKNMFVNTGKPIVGPVPGVEIGDEFHYRAELCVVGLHRSYQGGIDYSKIGGVLLAMSIVASVGHSDEMDSSDVLIYSGSGGSAAEGDKPAQDQKLERGNLALKNCIDAKTPVRVIRGFKELRYTNPQEGRPKLFSTFTYDGLYTVEDYWTQEAPQGFSLYKFKLRRIPGQLEIALKEVKKSKRSVVREGLCIEDISGGKEKLPIAVVNTIDDEKPAHFEYVTKMIYPSSYTLIPSVVCNCKRRCSDSENCACAVKNGGEIPYNFNGAIVQAKPLVYECGSSCNCPSSCYNRVSQHGIRIQLEIFKTQSSGWGVRSLNSIQSGSFICEYIGELIQDKEAEQRSNDEYLFDIGHNYEDHELWDDLPTLILDSKSTSPSKPLVEHEEAGFTIDAAKYGNVGRFINHSCSPNLYAQNVLYDHGDKRVPHIMFFAAENISPLQELTYHYNYKIGQVHDSEGNIKMKECFCGSHECTGRLY